MVRLMVLKIVPLVVLAATAGLGRASVITTGDVDPGGAATQPDPWAMGGGTLKVGNYGNGTLNVAAGGVVSNHNGYLGYEFGSIGEATVTGSGSQWNNAGVLNVARYGDGTLNVEAGGVVSNTYNGYIGRFIGATGAMTVTGTGSQWNNSASLYIGGTVSIGSGDSGTLNLNDSGLATVSGTTKLWSTGTVNLDGGSLTTGSFDNSAAGTLNFNDGMLTVNGASGVFNPGTNDFTIDGNTATDLPELVISNTASTTLSNNLTVGWVNRGNLTVEAGGIVSNYIGLIGRDSSSTGVATVTGSGSQWNNSSFLKVGDSGTGTLNIEAGGVVSNADGYIGYSSSTGEATVTGSGSQWTNSESLNVGGYGTGTLNITDSGIVSNTIGYIGRYAMSTGEATVTGSGSQWNNSGDLYVGQFGDGTLNVEAGGVVSNGWGYISHSSGSTGVATASGSGSQWTNSNALYVGYHANGTLNVTEGGVVSSMGGYISRYSDSTSVATVTGAGSQWNATTGLHVGYKGSGTLNIEAGGAVSNTNGYIGHYSGSTGVATVTGSGSQWNNSGDLVVGDEGNGALNIENEGLVAVGGTTSIGAMGTVNLSGGRFEFGQTTLTEFSSINAASGSLAGNLVHAGYTDVATLTALQNMAVDLTDVTLTNTGVLYGDASLGNALINTADGEVETMAGERMRFGGTGNTNAGEINNFNGMIRFARDMTNESDGFIGGRDTFFRFGGGLTNNGDIGLSVGIHDILGAIVNTATGRIMVAGQSTATFYGNMDNDGDIFTGQGSQSVFLGDVTGSGNFPGTGIVEFAGAISPGSSPAEVSFGGDVLIGPSSTTLIELAGTANGEYDRLLVAGALEVSGALEVQLLDGFAPSNYTAFEILTATDLSGEFSSLVLPDLLGNLSWDSSLLYSNGTLSVIPEPATLLLQAVGMLMACRRRRRS